MQLHKKLPTYAVMHLNPIMVNERPTPCILLLQKRMKIESRLFKVA